MRFSDSILLDQEKLDRKRLIDAGTMASKSLQSILAGSRECFDKNNDLLSGDAKHTYHNDLGKFQYLAVKMHRDMYVTASIMGSVIENLQVEARNAVKEILKILSRINKYQTDIVTTQ